MACNCHGGKYCCRNNIGYNLTSWQDFRHTYSSDFHAEFYKDDMGNGRCECGKIVRKSEEGEEDVTSNRP